MAQGLGVHTALAKDTGLVPNTHIRQFILTVTDSPQGSDTLLWPPRTPAWTGTQEYTHTFRDTRNKKTYFKNAHFRKNIVVSCSQNSASHLRNIAGDTDVCHTASEMSKLPLRSFVESNR